MNKLACFVFVLMAHAIVSSAQTTVRPAGDVKSVTRDGNQLSIQAENACIIIKPYSPSIIRVRMDCRNPGDDFSYAVVGKPQPAETRYSETPDAIFLQTDSLKVVIHKHPFSIGFYTLQNEALNEDEKGLGTSWIGSEVTTYKKLQEGERFIGLGEKTGNLDRAGNGYTNWNADVYGYSISQDPLYSSIPFYIGIHHGLNYGIFLDNSYQTDFNFGASNNRFSSFAAKNGEMNYYFIYDRSVAGIIRSYTYLTGRMHLPPLWSLGYQQNRYSYYPETTVLRIAQTLRGYKIPADGITLDIHYMDAYKLFTWNKDRFPSPSLMTDSLKQLGFHTTVIVDPGIKVEKGYPAYESGLKENIFLRYSDGQNFTGQVWPGWCHFPDFTSVKGREWWKQQVKFFADNGVSGIWNDMNEISTWGQKMPDNVLFDYDGHPTTHLQGHNVFGLEMVRSSYEGARATMKERPFILTRSGYAGLQRYAAIWTGDNRAEDDHMLAGVRLMNSLGLSGVAFTGMDIGGFTGNPSIGLYNRWMQLGAFLPYFRNHTAFNTRSSEPWAFGEDVLDNVRNYINLRYRLLPYLYAAFYQASQDGLPVMRSLAIEYTHDPAIYQPDFQNQYCLGKSFLVLPQESNKQFAKVYLPKGQWYDLYSGVREEGGREKVIELSEKLLPVYVREGSIIPMQSLVQSTTEKPTDTLTLHIYNGRSPNSFVYYEDDGTSYDYEKGIFYKREIRFEPAARKLVIGKAEGGWKSHFTQLLLLFHGFDETATLKVGGKETPAVSDHYSFLPGTGTGGDASTEVKRVVVGNDSGTIEVGF
jgi:alpha-glucosidase